MSARLRVLLASTSMMAILGGSAVAADYPLNFEERFEAKPAVSGINAKIEGSFTWVDIDGAPFDLNLWHGAGAISIPLTHSFGLQVDAGFGQLSATGMPFSSNLAGIGAHLFWRDPDMALLGVYGDYLRISNNFGSANAWRFGAEGELYLDRISVEVFAGGEHLSGGGFSDTFFTGEAMAAFYATDNIRVHGGIGRRFDVTYGRIGAEAIMPFASNNVALFGDGYFGSEFKAIRGGLRVYFGEPGKSLIDRHREDDPRIRLFDVFPVGGASSDNDDDGGDDIS